MLRDLVKISDVHAEVMVLGERLVPELDLPGGLTCTAASPTAEAYSAANFGMSVDFRGS